MDIEDREKVFACTKDNVKEYKNNLNLLDNTFFIDTDCYEIRVLNDVTQYKNKSIDVVEGASPGRPTTCSASSTRRSSTSPAAFRNTKRWCWPTPTSSPAACPATETEPTEQ